MTSLKKNVVANVIGQLYIAAIGIVMVPMYVRYMGMEAYGLISFFVALQTWFALLDMGISPTLIRELSRYRAGAVGQSEVWRFIRSAEWLFFLVGGFSLVIVVISSQWIAEHWLQLRRISAFQASSCVAMMGVMVGGRWLVSLYRSGLTGMDCLPAVNLVAMLLATLRSVLVLVVLIWVSSRCDVFFGYQVCVSAVELIAFCVLFYRALPGGLQVSLKPNMASLPVFSFAGAMAGLTLIWGVIGQVDRLVLSHYLDLATYGSYGIALIAAGSVTMLATPFIQALQPRLVFLFASQDETALSDTYRTATQMLMCLIAVAAGAAIFFGESILWAWTGNRSLAQQDAGVLALYAAGNAVLALSSLIFQLQYARGEIRRHVVGSIAFALGWVPSTVLASIYYGAEGAAWAWLGGNLVFFGGWMLGTQRRMLPDTVWNWMVHDVLRAPVTCLAVYAGLAYLHESGSRIGDALFVGGAAVVALLAGAGASPRLKKLGHIFIASAARRISAS